MAYDERCTELARHFLSDFEPKPAEDDVAILAQVIQDAAEAFLEDTKDMRDAPRVAPAAAHVQCSVKGCENEASFIIDREAYCFTHRRL